MHRIIAGVGTPLVKAKVLKRGTASNEYFKAPVTLLVSGQGEFVGSLIENNQDSKIMKYLTDSADTSLVWWGLSAIMGGSTDPYNAVIEGLTLEAALYGVKVVTNKACT